MRTRADIERELQDLAAQRRQLEERMAALSGELKAPQDLEQTQPTDYCPTCGSDLGLYGSCVCGRNN